MTTIPAWPADLGDDERITVTGPEGTESGTTIRVAASDRLTYRSDSGIEREVHDDDGVVIERMTSPPTTGPWNWRPRSRTSAAGCGSCRIASDA